MTEDTIGDLLAPLLIDGPPHREGRVAEISMDANRIVALGIPALTIGVGQHSVHQPKEWIDLSDFERVCRPIVEIALTQE